MSHTAGTTSIARRVVVELIGLYRVTLALLLGGHCRFSPSCSVYGQQAVCRYGVLTGLRLTAARLLRCHPWHAGGGDPVPELGPRSRP